VALTAKGSEVEGTINALNQASAISILRKSGMYPTSISKLEDNMSNIDAVEDKHSQPKTITISNDFIFGLVIGAVISFIVTMILVLIF
jgi:type II secretory pathway component PulF|tara:strand:+ start:5503 stop:5766 length:264 start_codon:yes stop_codon:yes gene_type:complete